MAAMTAMHANPFVSPGSYKHDSDAINIANALLTAQCRALEVYREMLAAGCPPNLVTYNTLIDLHGKTGQWAEALRTLEKMRAEVSRLQGRPGIQVPFHQMDGSSIVVLRAIV